MKKEFGTFEKQNREKSEWWRTQHEKIKNTLFTDLDKLSN